MKKHLNIHIYGKVQLVGYRFTAKMRADKLGVFGFVRNESDGSVYIEAEGHGKHLKEFVAWCKKGPMFARVKRVEIKEGNPGKFSGFKIIFR